MQAVADQFALKAAICNEVNRRAVLAWRSGSSLSLPCQCCRHQYGLTGVVAARNRHQTRDSCRRAHGNADIAHNFRHNRVRLARERDPAGRLRFWSARMTTIVSSAPFSTRRDIISAATALISHRIAAPTANVFQAEPRASKTKCFNFNIGLSLSSNTQKLRENG